MMTLTFVLLALCGIILSSAADPTQLRGSESALDRALRTEKPVLYVYSDNEQIWPRPEGFKMAMVNEVPSEIISIGKFAWDLIKNNKAVVDYNDDWAGAVPKEYADDLMKISGWKDKESKDFRFHYKVAGSTVSEFKWKWSWSYNGQDPNGKGKYIYNAGAKIVKLYARAGQTVGGKVESRAALNYGTPEDPIAGIDLEVTFSSANFYNEATTTCTVTVRGDGDMVLKSCDGNDP